MTRYLNESNSLEFRYMLSPTDSIFSSWSHSNTIEYATIPAVGRFTVEVRDPAGNINSTSCLWPTVDSEDCE